MNMKKLLTIVMLFAACSVNADAQGWFGKLKDKALDTVKGTVENKVEKEVGNATDDVLEGKKSSNNSKGDAGEAEEEVC